MSKAQARGEWAETRVLRHLQWRGWRCAARNWSGGGGELDLVCSRWRTLLVVEVRYRTHGDPLATIDHAKLSRTLSAAHALIRTYHLQKYHLRVDYAAVDARGSIRWRRAVQGLAH